MSLLTYGNPKTLKGRAKGWSTAVLHLAPANLSGYSVCPASTPECRAGCLNTAGRGGIPQKGFGPHLNAIQAARVRKTRLFYEDRPAFLSLLLDELHAHVKRAKAAGLKPAMRLNGTSDIAWEHVRYGGRRILGLVPGLRFYDYTKLKGRVLEQPYHLTFSRDEYTSPDYIRELAAKGINTAVVFDVRRKAPLPKCWEGLRVVDGDVNDLRFLDPEGVVVGLRAKGRAAAPFVVTL